MLLLLFLLLPLLFHLPVTIHWSFYFMIDRATKYWNRRNLVNFQRIELKLGGMFIRILRTIWFVRPFDCTVLSSDSLKKERLCLKIVLGQTGFELYCTLIFFCWTQPFWVRIGSACWRYRALRSLATAFFYIGYLCRIVEFPIVKMVFEFFLNLSVITNSSYVRIYSTKFYM